MYTSATYLGISSSIDTFESSSSYTGSTKETLKGSSHTSFRFQSSLPVFMIGRLSVSSAKKSHHLKSGVREHSVNVNAQLMLLSQSVEEESVSIAISESSHSCWHRYAVCGAPSSSDQIPDSTNEEHDYSQGFERD